MPQQDPQDISYWYPDASNCKVQDKQHHDEDRCQNTIFYSSVQDPTKLPNLFELEKSPADYCNNAGYPFNFL